MAYRGTLTRADVNRILTQRSKVLMREIKAGLEDYKTLLDAQNSQSVADWTRDLEGLADTKSASLTIVAATGVISCISGANLFAGFRIGRDVQTSSFTNAGNNILETEILAQTPDSITIATTGLVDETDTNARCQEVPIQAEKDETNAAIATALAFKKFDDLGTGATVTAEDLYALLRDYNL